MIPFAFVTEPRVMVYVAVVAVGYAAEVPVDNDTVKEDEAYVIVKII